jgi:hypothetical protein
LFLRYADDIAHDLAIVEPQDITFVLCIEGNRIEHQALLLCESIRTFAGRYRRSPILAVSPRPEMPVSESGRKLLARLGVEHVSAALNRTGSPYLPINRMVAGAWAEQNLATGYIVILDSDTLFLSEPSFHPCDAGARPVDGKAAASTGPADPQDAYWQRLCDLGGIAIDQLPWLTTTFDNVRVRASYNAGFSVVRRSCGILTKAAAVFLDSLRADLRPHRGTRVDMYASTGPVGHDASELWGSSQAALSVAITSRAQDLLIYGIRYNVPLHVMEPEGDGIPAWAAADPILVHYHWLAERAHHRSFLNRLARLRAGAPVLAWLAERLAAQPPDTATGGAASP